MKKNGSSEKRNETSTEQPEQRGRPGRRSVAERRTAVLDLLGGKATVEQLARRYGVLPETVEGWRAEAVTAMEDALRRGDGKTERELELERENALLREAVTQGTIQVALLQREISARPFKHGKSRT